MKYHKPPHSRLHHVETHRNDDGSYQVQAHLVHRPPHKEGKKDERHAYAMGSDEYPNKVVKHGAEDHEEASTVHGEILEAHRYDKGMSRGHGDPDATADEEYQEA